MNVVPVTVTASGGPLVVEVAASNSPNPVAGAVWEWDQTGAPVGGNDPAGQFTSQAPDVPLGSPGTIANHSFQVAGVVIALNNAPPVPYQVVVTVKQGGGDVHQDVPDNGSGQIGTTDQQFAYAFRIVPQ
jgi:hypothetical protein